MRRSTAWSNVREKQLLDLEVHGGGEVFELRPGASADDAHGQAADEEAGDDCHGPEDRASGRYPATTGRQ